MILFVLSSVLLVTCGSGSGGELIDLHIIGFFPCTDPLDKTVNNCDKMHRLPMVRLAQEEINERCDLLPGYQLVIDYADSGVSNKGYNSFGEEFKESVLL